MSILPEKCPFCGEKMEKGYLYTSHAFWWSKEKTKKSSINNRNSNENFWFNMSKEAHKCPKNKIVLFTC